MTLTSTRCQLGTCSLVCRAKKSQVRICHRTTLFELLRRSGPPPLRNVYRTGEGRVRAIFTATGWMHEGGDRATRGHSFHFGGSPLECINSPMSRRCRSGRRFFKFFPMGPLAAVNTLSGCHIFEEDTCLDSSRVCIAIDGCIRL